MGIQRTAESPVEVAVENIGGISETSIGFSPGVTILTGRNATNRTSFLRAVMAALGSDEAAVKGDANEGSVELKFDGDIYTRVLSRRDGTTVFEGKPFLDEAELSDLFAFLLESNDARQAIERGDDLYDVIMRPVDTAEINAEIAELDAELDEVDDQIEELASLKQRLPNLEEKRTQLETDIETKRDELVSKRADLDDREEGVVTPSQFEDHFEELREARNDLEDVRTSIEDEERLTEALRDDKREVETELNGLASVDEDELVELERSIDRHRDTIQSIESVLADLQSVIQFNESLVQGDAPASLDFRGDQADDESDNSVTDKLFEEGESVVCWTCGSEVERGEIDRTVDLLRNVHSEKIERRNSLREEIHELEGERKHIKRIGKEHRKLRRQLEEIEAEIKERAERVTELEAEAEALEKSVADIEAEIEALETDGQDELLALHREVNESEFELNRLESKLDEVEGEIGSIESSIEKRDQLDARREDIKDQIGKLRSRIERLEVEAVEQFNEQMEALLDLLEYGNLERIWIERVETEVESGRGSEQRPSFDLHVVRTTDSGSVYEDSIDHLSESEREVVGLVFALSGYLVHEVYDQLPFMLLDSIEAFDSGRISALVDHFAQFADYLVVALLPEDAAALNEEYQRITDI